MTEEQGDVTREGRREEDEEIIARAKERAAKKRRDERRAMDENERIKEEGSVCCALANERARAAGPRQGPYTDGPFFDPTPTPLALALEPDRKSVV